MSSACMYGAAAVSDSVNGSSQFWMKIAKKCKTPRALNRDKLLRASCSYGVWQTDFFYYFEALMITG